MNALDLVVLVLDPRRRRRRLASRVRRARARVGRRRRRARRSARTSCRAIVTAFGGTRPENRASVAVLFLVLAAIARPDARARARRARAPGRARCASRCPRWDRLAGARVGVLGVLVLLWMVIPSFATAKGWPARMARGSTIVAAIERWAPTQPARFAAWGRAISDAPFPSALGTLQSPPNPGPPPGTSITPAVDARVRASTVKVTGRACDEIQEGSGWVAAPGLVVTNAHVVAGEQRDHRPGRDRARAHAGDGRRVRSGPRRRGARRARRSPRAAAPDRRRARSATSARSTGIPGGGAAARVTGTRRRRDPRGRHRHLPHGIEPPARVRARRRRSRPATPAARS